MNPKYTFDNFIVGSFNELTYSVAQVVIKNSDNTYNPVLLFGVTGSGKTHLVQAIGNQLEKEGKNVYYGETKDFCDR